MSTTEPVGATSREERPPGSQGLSLVKVGVAACAACCAAPLAVLLAAAGFTVVSVAALGVAGLLVAIPAGVWAVRRRHRHPG